MLCYQLAISGSLRMEHGPQTAGGICGIEKQMHLDLALVALPNMLKRQKDHAFFRDLVPYCAVAMWVCFAMKNLQPSERFHKISQAERPSRNLKWCQTKSLFQWNPTDKFLPSHHIHTNTR